MDAGTQGLDVDLLVDVGIMTYQRLDDRRARVGRLRCQQGVDERRGAMSIDHVGTSTKPQQLVDGSPVAGV